MSVFGVLRYNYAFPRKQKKMACVKTVSVHPFMFVTAQSLLFFWAGQRPSGPGLPHSRGI
jgi:hypothetical protein